MMPLDRWPSAGYDGSSYLMPAKRSFMMSTSPLRHPRRLACFAVVAMTALSALLLSPAVQAAEVNELRPDPATLEISRLIQGTSILFRDGESGFQGLSVKALIDGTAAPKELIAKDGTLQSPWGGAIRVAPYGDDAKLGRINLAAVPRPICIEIGFLLAGQPPMVGFYIDGNLMSELGGDLGALLARMADACQAGGSSLDIIIQ